MKNLMLLILLLAGITYGASAQTNVTIHMAQFLDGVPFAYNQPAQSETGYSFKVSRLEYYISEIKLIHDGGIITPVTDLYFLVDPAIHSTLELGSWPVTSLEKIQFSIGVDSAHNHLDPSLYPNGHPLAPQDPSMHWGWTSGYRFIAFEGFAGADSNSLNNNYQIHTIGDENYRVVLLDVIGETQVDSMAVHIEAEYAYLLYGIDASSGLISHSSMGASNEIAENTRSVFRAAEPTGIVEPEVEGSFLILPNPARDFITSQYNLPGYEHFTFTVYDLAGRMISLKKLNSSNTSFLLETNWQSGMYIARIESSGKLLAYEKLVIE
jgi:hypothetical protein